MSMLRYLLNGLENIYAEEAKIVMSGVVSDKVVMERLLLLVRVRAR